MLASFPYVEAEFPKVQFGPLVRHSLSFTNIYGFYGQIVTRIFGFGLSEGRHATVGHASIPFKTA